MPKEAQPFSNLPKLEEVNDSSDSRNLNSTSELGRHVDHLDLQKQREEIYDYTSKNPDTSPADIIADSIENTCLGDEGCSGSAVKLGIYELANSNSSDARGREQIANTIIEQVPDEVIRGAYEDLSSGENAPDLENAQTQLRKALSHHFAEDNGYIVPESTSDELTPDSPPAPTLDEPTPELSQSLDSGKNESSEETPGPITREQILQHLASTETETTETSSEETPGLTAREQILQHLATTENETAETSGDRKIRSEEIFNRMESEKFIKEAPRLANQLKDERNNEIVYIGGQSRDLRVNTSDKEYESSRLSLSESESLRELDKFLEYASMFLNGRNAKIAESMRDNLTFIGEKEYKEATAGIAASWKVALEKQDTLQIYAVAEIAKAHNPNTPNEEDLQIKSDEYLLDNILSNFSEEDWAKYGNRIVFDEADITAKDDKDLKVVLLDDWTISGSQLNTTYSAFIKRHPDMIDSVEVQLIAASKDRITNGLKARDNQLRDVNIPLKAYYQAHHSDEAGMSDTHITGYYSSVDFDFGTLIEDDMIDPLTKATGQNFTMPPLTNIVRPYRNNGMARDKLENIKRAQQEVVGAFLDKEIRNRMSQVEQNEKGVE